MIYDFECLIFQEARAPQRSAYVHTCTCRYMYIHYRYEWTLQEVAASLFILYYAAVCVALCNVMTVRINVWHWIDATLTADLTTTTAFSTLFNVCLLPGLAMRWAEWEAAIGTTLWKDIYYNVQVIWWNFALANHIIFTVVLNYMLVYWYVSCVIK